MIICGVEATPADDHRKRVQPSRSHQLFRQLHPLFIFQFQIPRHVSTLDRFPVWRLCRGDFSGSAQAYSRCHDDSTRRRCPKRGKDIVIAVDIVRATGTPPSTGQGFTDVNKDSRLMAKVKDSRCQGQMQNRKSKLTTMTKLIWTVNTRQTTLVPEVCPTYSYVGITLNLISTSSTTQAFDGLRSQVKD